MCFLFCRRSESHPTLVNAGPVFRRGRGGGLAGRITPPRSRLDSCAGRTTDDEGRVFEADIRESADLQSCGDTIFPSMALDSAGYITYVI